MYYSFGQICVQLLIPDVLSGYLPKKWDAYSLLMASPPESDLSVSFELFPLSDGKICAEGWETIAYCGKRLNVFSRNSRAVFAIESLRSKKEMKVYVNGDIQKSFCLGLQFSLLIYMYQEYIGLHGVTLVCEKEIIILSAPSGTGKTTLAKLLEHYSDAVVINGDFALLKPTEEGVLFEPTPFCGTSGRCLNHRFLVNRIVFLEQSNENAWHDCSGREAIKRFMDNAFVPNWDCSMLQAVQENILKSLSMLKVNTYEFTPTKKAAETFVNNLSYNNNYGGKENGRF